MSVYRIALAVFLAAIGLVFVFGLGRTAEVVAGVAALVAAVCLLIEGANTRPTV